MEHEHVTDGKLPEASGTRVQTTLKKKEVTNPRESGRRVRVGGQATHPSPIHTPPPRREICGSDRSIRRRRRRWEGDRERGMEEAAEKALSYRYWVREATGDAAPLPIPRKLDPAAAAAATAANGNGNPAPLGSVWNQAGTWEEKNLNSWANSRIKDLLGSLGSLEFPTGKASIEEVSKCSGDAFQVTVRNKKRVGYNYELTLKFRGEWLIKEESKEVKGHLDIPEFSFGELDDLEVQVRFSDDKGLASDHKTLICKDLKSFLAPIQEKLRVFEVELKGR
ncbi:uncharacterized protein LOC133918339 [Phragmites australis]|uniref:uncharacterized protein LOC133918339 n=1 Tax=Phragmites australis TaxID=29695 RepID=UPI002D768667|nr:uncharacterized protein LOC133918339 [Phragmites australis]